MEVTSTEDAIIFDFSSVTTPGPGGEVTGLEAVMQVRGILLQLFSAAYCDAMWYYVAMHGWPGRAHRSHRLRVGRGRL